MGTRLELQTLLESKLGSRNVYFQPPESIRISYPAIVYSLSSISQRFADDTTYHGWKRYTVTYISSDPDDLMVDSLLTIPKCSFDRRFVSDNLYHNTFNLYF